MPNTASKFYVPGLMDLSKYRIVPARLDDKWDAFVEMSPQGTIFQTSDFLSCFNLDFCAWYCLKNNQTVGAMVTPLGPDGISSPVPAHIIHNGLMFTPAQNNQNQAQVLSEQFRISLCFIEAITQKFDTLTLTHHSSLTDLRPFQWHNYHNDGPKFTTEIRYTSYLQFTDDNSFDLSQNDRLFLACNTSRRQEIRAGIKDELQTSTDINSQLFTALYEKTFNAQGIFHSATDMQDFAELIDKLSQTGRVRMFSTYDKQGNLGSSAIFGIDRKRAYYLYGGMHPDMKKKAFGTTVLWDAFKALHQQGIREIDLEGINSPARGYFKLSFGGDLIPYYRTHWKKLA